MNLDRYRYVLSYFRRFEPELFKDICHNAYLTYWKYYHRDLFDESVPYIIGCMRQQGITDWYKKEQTNWRDSRKEGFKVKEFLSLSPFPESLSHLRYDDKTNEQYQNAFYQAVSSRNNPYEEMVAKELLDQCYKAICAENRVTNRGVKRDETLPIRILELKLAGFRDPEIGKILHISKGCIRKYTNNLEMLTNPINGNKLKITKQISLHTWEKRSDKDDYEFDDGNEFYSLYKHKESKDGLLVKLPAGKTNPYIK